MAIFENFPYSNFHEVNLDWVISEVKRISKLVDTVTLDVDAFIAAVLAEVSPEKIQEIVEQWFEDHPEYMQYINRYVTPQDYGALGDGVNDDTQAIRDALASGADIYFPVGEYKITSSIGINDRTDWNFDASNAKFTCTIVGFAFRIRNVERCSFKFDVVESSGGCILFNTSTNTDKNFDVEVTFNELHPAPASDGILIESRNGASNEKFTINGGVIDQGAQAIHLYNNASDLNNVAIRSVFFDLDNVTAAVYVEGAASTDYVYNLTLDMGDLDTSAAGSLITVSTAKIEGLWIRCPIEVPEAMMTLGSSTDVRISSVLGDKYYNASRGYWIQTHGYFTSLLEGGMEIPTNMDLNTPAYCIPGEYYSLSPTHLSNCPTVYIFHMTVRTVIRNYNTAGGSNYILREIFDQSPGCVRYYQYVSYNGNTWTYNAWKKVTPTNA